MRWIIAKKYAGAKLVLRWQVRVCVCRFPFEPFQLISRIRSRPGSSLYSEHPLSTLQFFSKMSNCSRNVATCSHSDSKRATALFRSRLLLWSAILTIDSAQLPTKLSKCRTQASPSCSSCLQPACRVSEISSRLFVMPTRTSNILSYPRRSALAALARADHGVWLRYFTVGVSSDWDKIIQRCVESLKNASSLCYEEDRKNVVASGNNHSMEWSVPQNNHARTMPEHPHIIFLPYCWRRRVSVHSISW